MRKLLLRSFSILLIPCLTVDPVLAAFGGMLPSARGLSQSFTRQALAVSSLTTMHPMRTQIVEQTSLIHAAQHLDGLEIPNQRSFLDISSDHLTLDDPAPESNRQARMAGPTGIMKFRTSRQKDVERPIRSEDKPKAAIDADSKPGRIMMTARLLRAARVARRYFPGEVELLKREILRPIQLLVAAEKITLQEADRLLAEKLKGRSYLEALERLLSKRQGQSEPTAGIVSTSPEARAIEKIGKEILNFRALHTQLVKVLRAVGPFMTTPQRSVLRKYVRDAQWSVKSLKDNRQMLLDVAAEREQKPFFSRIFNELWLVIGETSFPKTKRALLAQPYVAENRTVWLRAHSTGVLNLKTFLFVPLQRVHEILLGKFHDWIVVAMWKILLPVHRSFKIHLFLTREGYRRSKRDEFVEKAHNAGAAVHRKLNRSLKWGIAALASAAPTPNNQAMQIFIFEMGGLRIFLDALEKRILNFANPVLIETLMVYGYEEVFVPFFVVMEEYRTIDIEQMRELLTGNRHHVKDVPALPYLNLLRELQVVVHLLFEYIYSKEAQASLELTEPQRLHAERIIRLYGHTPESLHTLRTAA